MLTFLAGWADTPDSLKPSGRTVQSAGARPGGWCCLGWAWAFCCLDSPCITRRLWFGISVAPAIVLDRGKASYSGIANLATCINTGLTQTCPSHWQWLFFWWESKITDAFSDAKLLLHLRNKYWWPQFSMSDVWRCSRKAAKIPGSCHNPMWAMWLSWACQAWWEIGWTCSIRRAQHRQKKWQNHHKHTNSHFSEWFGENLL